MAFAQIDFEKMMDRSSAAYVAQFYGDYIQNEATLDGENVFKVLHEEMVQKWNATQDYELGVLEKGVCKTCCCTLDKMHQLKEVVTQVGAARFGLRVGICLACINYYTKDGSTLMLQWLKFTVPFASSSDVHTVSITLPLLQSLVSRESPIGETEAERPISDLNKFVLNKILSTHNQLLEKSLKEQTKPFSCKKCQKLKINYEDSFLDINGMRKAKRIAGICLGCGMGTRLTSGCSMLTCEFCVSSTKTCIVCMEGAAGFPHSLTECSDKMRQLLNHPDTTDPLPPLMKCDCFVAESETITTHPDS